MNKKVIKIVLIFAFILISYNVISNAGISSTSATIQSGEQVSILVSSDTQLSAYTVKVTGHSGLEFVTSSGGSGAGTTSISDAKAEGGMTRLATFKFKAPNVDKDQTYQVTFLGTGMGDLNLNAVADSTCTSTITVKAKQQAPETPTTPSTPTAPNTPETPKTKSSVATLADLGITPNDFKGFKKDKFSYDVEVPNDVEKIEIYAKSPNGENNQKISGHGANKTLNVGANKFEIVVTAEDGKTTNTYTINVTRKESEEDKEETEENPEEQPMEEAFGLTELTIEGIKLNPEFKTDVYEYKVDLKEELEKLKITTVATDVNTNIEILGNENLKEGENTITIHVKNESGEKNATYQITVNKVVSTVENVITEEQNSIADTTEITLQNQNNKKRVIMVVIVAAVIAIIAIIFIVNNRKKSYFEEERYVTYGDDLQNTQDIEDDPYEEIIKRRKARGKRFK